MKSSLTRIVVAICAGILLEWLVKELGVTAPYALILGYMLGAGIYATIKE